MLALKKYLILAVIIGLVGWVVYSNINKSQANGGKAEPATSVQQNGNESAKPAIGLKKGNEAPDFSLTTSDGKTVKLSDFRGKKVLLNFWATWCPPCRQEIPDMVKYYEANKDKNMIILGVNLTQAEKDPTTVPQFLKDNGITYPVLLDTKGIVADQFQVSGIPTSYFIDSKGVIRQVYTGAMTYEFMDTMLSNLQ